MSIYFPGHRVAPVTQGQMLLPAPGHTISYLLLIDTFVSVLGTEENMIIHSKRSKMWVPKYVSLLEPIDMEFTFPSLDSSAGKQGTAWTRGGARTPGLEP